LAPGTPETVNQWLKEKIDEYELKFDIEHAWPTLSRQILTGSTEENSLKAWKNAFKPLRDFRQAEDIGRNKGSQRPGRSRWPEPDTLRRIFRYSPQHKPDPDMPDGFPRAMFGLPIIFEFRGDPKDPPKSELYPRGKKRMGSPIILRPLKMQNTQNLPMAVFLSVPAPEFLEIKGRKTSFGVDSIVSPVFAKYRNSPILGRSINGNAIEAFIAYLKDEERGFQEVSL
jgi:CRISPR-associated protein Cmr1